MKKSKLSVEIFNQSHHPLPQAATSLSAGMDLRAFLPNGSIVLQPMERVIVPTGLSIALPQGYEAQIRPRSGLAARLGIMCILGTIDADYRGDIGVILINLSNEPFTINDGERVAQMVVAQHERVRWIPTIGLSETERGTGGFGHTGTK